MCDPLTIAATAAMAASQGMSALQANAQAQYRAKIADRNAKLEIEAGQQERQNIRDEAQAKYREIAKIKGQQRVTAGANGVAIDFGTAGDVQADTQAMGSEDVNRIYQRAIRPCVGAILARRTIRLKPMPHALPVRRRWSRACLIWGQRSSAVHRSIKP